MTYSIVAYDPETRQFGVAVQNAPARGGRHRALGAGRRPAACWTPGALGPKELRVNTRQLERDLLIELEGTIEAARQRNYVPTYFLRMLAEHGAAATVRKLLEKSEPQEGLFRLYELDLLDESMEAIVIKQKYQTLFTAEELEVATKRLDELGYFKGRT